MTAKVAAEGVDSALSPLTSPAELIRSSYFVDGRSLQLGLERLSKASAVMSAQAQAEVDAWAALSRRAALGGEVA